MRKSGFFYIKLHGTFFHLSKPNHPHSSSLRRLCPQRSRALKAVAMVAIWSSGVNFLPLPAHRLLLLELGGCALSISVVPPGPSTALCPG